MLLRGSNSMHYFVYTLVIWGMVFLFVGEKFYNLCIYGLLVAGLEVIVDSLAIKYNLYCDETDFRVNT